MGVSGSKLSRQIAGSRIIAGPVGAPNRRMARLPPPPAAPSHLSKLIQQRRTRTLSPEASAPSTPKVRFKAACGGEGCMYTPRVSALLDS
jgi:hypothetical protein